MRPPSSLSELSRSELESLLIDLFGEVSGLKQLVATQRDEIARLKGEKGRPTIKSNAKPSGMEKATEPGKLGKGERRRGRGKIQPTVAIEDKIVPAPVPEGSVFKGYKDYVVQDLMISVEAIRYRRACWLTPEGKTIVAPLPEGLSGHFGPQLRRFVLMQYHQGQTTLPRLVAQLRAIGIAISKRQVQRLLTEGQEAFLAEDRAVLRAGLETAGWVSVDDTGARHRAKNGFCTQIGDDRFTAFRTSGSKSRLNFLGLLRAGHTDFVLNDMAFGYMREHGLSKALLDRLADRPETGFADPEAWKAHLAQLGFDALNITPMPADRLAGHRFALRPDPVRVATEGALWGAVHAHGFLRDSVVLSDDAGQFNIGRHALCWVHAERLVHKLDAFTAQHRAAQKQVRGMIWRFYAALKDYRLAPSPSRRHALRTRFDRIFRRRTGFATLDRLLARLHANKPELLMVLERPEIPLHTNGSENDIRCQVTRRKVSAGTRSDLGRDCRDAFLGLAKTCMKQGIEFWDYLGNRLKVPGYRDVRLLADYLRAQPQPA